MTTFAKKEGVTDTLCRVCSGRGFYARLWGGKGFFTSGEKDGFLLLAGRWFAVSGLTGFACKGWLLTDNVCAWSEVGWSF